MLPNFLLIGAAKAGTSAIYNYLWQHPDIYMSGNKEPNFFLLNGQAAAFAGPGDEVVNVRSVHRLDEYEALFAGVTTEKRIGEASPAYLRSEMAAARMAEQIPNAKLIALLRNPVERALSCFQHARRDQREPMSSLLQAIEEEQTRIANNWENLWYYTTGGFYHEQLQAYYERFPKEQIGIFLYEDFVAEPLETMQQIFQFLDVEPFEPDMSVRYNVSGQARSKMLQSFLAKPNGLKNLLKPLLPSYVRQRMVAQMMSLNVEPSKQGLSQQERAMLQSLFHDDIVQLQQLIGRELSHWLRA